MPSASKYIVDINKIRKPNNVGTGGIFVGLGGSNRESLYAVRGTGSGHVVIYDKVKYDLSVDNISNQQPDSHSVTFTYSSKRTHGNNAVDTLSITPKTYTIEANTSTSSTKTTIVEVKQTLADGATLTGNTVNVTITQIPDYATEIFLTISPKSTIPASGGSIPSGLTNFTYSVKANHKSGNNNVDVTSLASITANVTGVTAPSKGVTASTETTAGNITFTATYSGLTSQVIVPIKQNENKVESYAAPTYTLSPGNTVLPASGGSVTGSISTPQQVRTWSSTATDTYNPTYTSTWTAQTISCNSRGTTTGDQTTLGTTQITVTANGKSTTKSYTVYQQANAVTNSDYNASNIDYWASCSIGDGLTAAGGSASVSASAGHTHKYYYLYTSTSTSGPYYSYPGDTVTTAMVGNGNNRFSYSNGTITHSSMGTTATTDTVTIRATNSANTSATGDASKSIVNQVTNDNYSPYSYYASCSIGDGLTAGGGSATVTASAGHYSYYLYTSGSYDGGGHHHSDGVTTAMVGNGNNRFSYSNGTITHSSMGTTATTDTVTIRATNSTNGSTADASKSIVNQVTNDNYSPYSYSASVSVGNGISAAGGSATVTASAEHYSYYLYTSGSYDGGGHWHSDGVSTEMTENGNNRFSYNTSTKVITHSSMGTDVTTDYVTIKATNTTNTSATASTRPGWSNAITNYDYNASDDSYWADCSIGDGMTAAGGSATVSASAGHRHIYYYYYTSTSTSGPYYSYPGDTVTTEMVGNGNNRFSYNTSTKVITHSDMTTNVATDTVTIRATNSANTSATKDASKSIVNQVTNDNYSPYSYSASVSVGNGISAAGGSATVTASAGHYSYYLYTSGSYDSGGHWHSDGVSTQMTENGNNRFTYNANTLALSHSSMGTDVTTDYVTIKATNTTNTSATASTRPGWSNAVTSTTWGDITGTPTGSCSDIPAGGGTVTATTTTPQTLAQNYKYSYTSGSQDPNWKSTNVSCSVAYTGGTTATASSLGTTVKARTHVATLTVRASANGKTKDGSVYVYQQANAVTSTSYETPVVTVPSNQSVASSAGEFTLTSANTYATQAYSTTYTSGSRGSGTNNYYVYNCIVTSNNAEFTIVEASTYKNVSWGVNTGATTRSATITATLTANGKSGSASFDITQSSPAPTTASFTIVNYLGSSTYGTWTISAAGQSISGDISAGEEVDYYWPSSVFPFTVTSWGPGSLSPNSYSEWQIACSSDAYSNKIRIKKNAYGAYEYVSGSITVTEGSTIRMDVW